jgi:hypothetical protein
MPPKTASQSLTKSLLESDIQFNAILSRPKIHLWLSELCSEFNIDPKEYKIVQIVRDPYERYISAYLHQQRLLPKNNILKDISIDDFSKRLIECLKYPNFIEKFYGSKQFLINTIKAGRNWGGVTAFQPQLDWNDLDCKVTYFKLEDIQKDITPLEKYLKAYIPALEKKNVSTTEKKPEHYTPTVFKTVESLYEKDFKKFGYTYL